MNKLQLTFHNFFQSKFFTLTGNDDNLKDEANYLFDKFLEIISRKNNKIKYYVEHRPNKEFKRIFVSSEHFTFEMKLERSGHCKLRFIKNTFVEKSFNSDLLRNHLVYTNGVVYFLKSQFGIKIGCSKNLSGRLKEFAAKLPFSVELHSFIRTVNYMDLEKAFHQLLAKKRLDGEWFQLDDSDWDVIDLLCKHNRLLREVAILQNKESEVSHG